MSRAEELLSDQGRLALLSQVRSMGVINRLQVDEWDDAAAVTGEGERLAKETGQPLIRRLLSLFAARVGELPAPSRELLLLASLDGTGDLGVLEAAGQRSADELAPAEQAGLVCFDGPGERLTGGVELLTDQAAQITRSMRCRPPTSLARLRPDR